MGNHDMKRFLTDANGSTEKLKLAFSLLATLRGIPQLYYGDEIAMPGAEDPDNRHDFPGGFPGDTHDAFSQSGRTPEEQDVFAHVQTLLKLRAEHVALRRGVQKHVAAGDKYYAFTREAEGEQLLIVFHSGETAESVAFDVSGTTLSDTKKLTPLFAASAVQLQGTELRIELAPMSVAIYKVEK
jgi:glycosidase